jgi:hypothetical protein
MNFVQRYKRLALLPLAGLGLAAYYFAVFVPLSHRVDDLDVPLERAWQTLAGSLDRTNALTLDFRAITNQLNETRQALAVLQRTKRKAIARLELGAAVRAELDAPFQLVDYQNERSKLADELSQLAKQQQVTLEPAVLAGFPEHTADVPQPALLWSALSFVDGLLTTTIRCKVATIHSLDAPPLLPDPSAANASASLTEIPLQIDFTGPVASVTRLLQSLPLRAEELRAAGLPEASPDKLPLFVDRLLIKKQSPDKPDEVRVSLRVIGFVLRE